jgi:hypothetical protein
MLSQKLQMSQSGVKERRKNTHKACLTALRRCQAEGRAATAAGADGFVKTCARFPAPQVSVESPVHAMSQSEAFAAVTGPEYESEQKHSSAYSTAHA